jgi:hypothetical protein
MNCPYCTQIIPDDVVFCPKCGTQMGSPLPGSAAYRPPLPPDFRPPTSGKAVGSLVSGLFFFLPASLLAVILGHLSLSEIRKGAGRLKGQGLATAGLVLGYLGIALIPFILIIAAIAIPNLLRAKIAANEASAVGALHSYSYALEATPRSVLRSAFLLRLLIWGIAAPPPPEQDPAITPASSTKSSAGTNLSGLVMHSITPRVHVTIWAKPPISRLSPSPLPAAPAACAPFSWINPGWCAPVLPVARMPAVLLYNGSCPLLGICT